MSNFRPFTEADAATLRHEMPSFAWRAASEAQPALVGSLCAYFHHYGFATLFNAAQVQEYELTFVRWGKFDVARHSWKRQQAKGTVVVVHGLFDHTGLYLRLVQRLLLAGYNVVAFDLPGHGLSSGRRVSISDFDDYREVLSECIAWCRSRFGGPCHTIGQSTGCSAILSLLQTAPAESDSLPDRSVLLAPLVRVYSWGWIRLLSSLLGRCVPRVRRHFGNNSHDRAFLDFLAHQDPLQTRHIDVQWVGSMLTWASRFTEQAVQQHALLICQGTDDRTVDWRKNIPLIQQQFPNARVHWLEGAHHHLVNEAEPWRKPLFDAIVEYLNTGSP